MLSSIFLSCSKYTDEQITTLIRESARLGGLISSKANFKLRKGVFGRSKEKMSEDGKKGYKAAFLKHGIGLGQTKEQLIENQIKSTKLQKEKILSNPEFLLRKRQIGLNNIRYLTKENRIKGGQSAGRNRSKEHIKKMSVAGGKSHKGRKIIEHTISKQRKRPKLEIAAELVASGHWIYVKKL